MLSIALAALISVTASQSSWPDPYIGFAFQSFDEEKFLGYDASGDPILDSGRRKYLQLGAPLRLQTLNWGNAKNLQVLIVPEIAFNHSMVHLNIGMGLEQDLPLTGYRSFPAGFFWGVTGGLHYGVILDAKDYRIVSNRDDETQTFTSKKYNFFDQTSIAAQFRFAFGPRFYVNSTMDLKFRLFFDFMVGKIGPNQSRTTFSDNVGSLLGFQIQFVFK